MLGKDLNLVHDGRHPKGYGCIPSPSSRLKSIGLFSTLQYNPTRRSEAMKSVRLLGGTVRIVTLQRSTVEFRACSEETCEVNKNYKRHL